MTSQRSDTYPTVRLHIAGEWRDSGAGRSAPVVNPATEETIGTVPLATTADLDDALVAAEGGFRTWRSTPSAAAPRSSTGPPT